MLCQVMADMKKVYDDLIIINLYLIQLFSRHVSATCSILPLNKRCTIAFARNSNMCGPKTLCYTTDNVCYLVQDVQEGMKIAKNSQKKPNFAKFLLLFCLFRWALAKLNICENSFLSPHANPQDRFFKLVNGFRHWETLSLEQIIRHSELELQIPFNRLFFNDIIFKTLCVFCTV